MASMKEKFAEFMAIYNLMKGDQDEIMRIKSMPLHQQQLQSPSLMTETIPDDDNIEIQADFLFTGSHVADKLQSAAEEPIEHDEDHQVSSSQQQHQPGVIVTPKSYPPDRTEGMKQRAKQELDSSPRQLSAQWLVKEKHLKQIIAGLKFFSDVELNKLLIRVLERKDCIDSPARAVRAVARIYWDDEEMVSKHLRRGYYQSTHRNSGSGPDLPPLPFCSDIHDLFMILHEIKDVEKWVSSGRLVWLYNTLYALRQSIKKQKLDREPDIVTSSSRQPAAARARRSGSTCSNSESLDDQPGSESKRMRPDDDSVSSSDATASNQMES